MPCTLGVLIIFLSAEDDDDRYHWHMMSTLMLTQRRDTLTLLRDIRQRCLSYLSVGGAYTRYLLLDYYLFCDHRALEKFHRSTRGSIISEALSTNGMPARGSTAARDLRALATNTSKAVIAQLG